MSRKLAIGDGVVCRFYNTPEGKFYGDYWQGIIINISPLKPGDNLYDYNNLRDQKKYSVLQWNKNRVDLTRKEIRYRVNRSILDLKRIK